MCPLLSKSMNVLITNVKKNCLFTCCGCVYVVLPVDLDLSVRGVGYVYVYIKYYKYTNSSKLKFNTSINIYKLPDISDSDN